MHFLYNALYDNKLVASVGRRGRQYVLDLGGGRYDFYHSHTDGVLSSDAYLFAEGVDAVLRAHMAEGSYGGYNGGLPCLGGGAAAGAGGFWHRCADPPYPTAGAFWPGDPQALPGTDG